MKIFQYNADTNIFEKIRQLGIAWDPVNSPKQFFTSIDIFTEEYLVKRGWRNGNLVILPVWIDHDSVEIYKIYEPIRSAIDYFKKLYDAKYLEEVIRIWCQKNCIDKWDKFLKYGIEFRSEIDLVHFKLSWCV